MSTFGNFLFKLTDQFIPEWLSRRLGGRSRLELGRPQPILVSVSDPYKVYCNVPHLRAVINKKGKMLANMKVKLFDSQGKEVESHPALDLLKKPTAIQNFKQWTKQWNLMNSLMANVFTYMLKGSRLAETPAALWNLPPDEMEILFTGKLFEQTDINEIISGYKLLLNQKVYTAEEIIHMSNNDSKDYLKGETVLEPLQRNLSNIVGALETRNVLLYERGAFGILGPDHSSELGGMPLTKEVRKRLQDEYQQNYGIGHNRDGHSKDSIIISERAVKWTPMTYPTKDLLLFEEIEDDFQAILDQYGMMRELFASLNGAKFENQKEAKLATYQDTIIPEADDMMMALSDGLGLTAEGLELRADYSHLPIMQKDAKTAAEAFKTLVEALSQAYQDEAITLKEYQEALGDVKELA